MESARTRPTDLLLEEVYEGIVTSDRRRVWNAILSGPAELGPFITVEAARWAGAVLDEAVGPDRDALDMVLLAEDLALDAERLLGLEVDRKPLVRFLLTADVPKGSPRAPALVYWALVRNRFAAHPSARTAPGPVLSGRSARVLGTLGRGALKVVMGRVVQRELLVFELASEAGVARANREPTPDQVEETLQACRRLVREGSARGVGEGAEDVLATGPLANRAVLAHLERGPEGSVGALAARTLARFPHLGTPADLELTIQALLTGEVAFLDEDSAVHLRLVALVAGLCEEVEVLAGGSMRTWGPGAERAYQLLLESLEPGDPSETGA